MQPSRLVLRFSGFVFQGFPGAPSAFAVASALTLGEAHGAEVMAKARRGGPLLSSPSGGLARLEEL